MSEILWMVEADRTNIATTRTAAELYVLRFFFDSVHSPEVIWSDLAMLHLKRGGPTQKLNLQGVRLVFGEVLGQFRSPESFKCLRTLPDSDRIMSAIRSLWVSGCGPSYVENLHSLSALDQSTGRAFSFSGSLNVSCGR